MATISDVRDFWNARPCNIRHSKEPICTKQYFDEVEEKKYRVEPHIPKFAQFDRWKGKRVLEIGCGIGTDTLNFVRAGAHVTAVDLSKESIAIARKRLEVFGFEGGAVFHEANVEALSDVLPKQDIGKYDLIYSFGVLHHTPNPKRAVAQLAPFLRPFSGELRIMVYSLVSFKAFHFMHHTPGKWSVANMRDTIREFAEAQTGCPVAYVYDEDGVDDLLAPHFQVQSVWKDHIFTWDIEAYKQGIFKKDEAWEGVDDATTDRLAKDLGWHTMVVAKHTQKAAPVHLSYE